MPSHRATTSLHFLLTLGFAGVTASAAHAADGEPASAAFPYPIVQQSLENGLRVYVVPMRGSPGVAAWAVWMSVGSRNEVEQGRTGFAHFFEHLMFHGTATLPGDARDRELLRLGAEDNAWTWLDETVYHTLVPTASLPRLVEMEGDRFQHLELKADPLRREAGAVYGEFRKGQADPDQVLSELLYRTAFTVHPYGHDTIGLEGDIAAFPDRFEDALAFFDRYYRPENAAVVVVGDVDPAAVQALVQARLGEWARGTLPPLPVPAEPPQTAPRRAEVAWPTEAAPRLAMAWKVPAADADGSEVAQLELGARLLLSTTGALERRLVREDQLAYSVSGGRYETVDPGLLVVNVEARAAEDLPRIEAIVREEVANLAASVDPAALEALRTRLKYQFLSGLDDPMTVLNVVGEAIRRDPDPTSVDRWQATLAAVTPEQVAQSLRTTLVDSRLTVVTLKPAAGATP